MPIVKTAKVLGGSARVMDTRIPVWELVAYKQDGMSNSDLLDSFPRLTHKDLEDAWDYFKNNIAEIVAEIVENQS